jgi:hypothetical protein
MPQRSSFDADARKLTAKIQRELLQLNCDLRNTIALTRQAIIHSKQLMTDAELVLARDMLSHR